MIKYTLSDDLKRKEQLTAAGIETIGDLLSYYPFKYKDRRHLVRAMDAGTEKDSLTCGRLIKVQLRPLSGGRSITECTLDSVSMFTCSIIFSSELALNLYHVSPANSRWECLAILYIDGIAHRMGLRRVLLM